MTWIFQTKSRLQSLTRLADTPGKGGYRSIRRATESIVAHLLSSTAVREEDAVQQKEKRVLKDAVALCMDGVGSISVRGHLVQFYKPKEHTTCPHMLFIFPEPGAGLRAVANV